MIRHPIFESVIGVVGSEDIKAHASQRWSFRGAALSSALRQLRGKLSLCALDKKPRLGLNSPSFPSFQFEDSFVPFSTGGLLSFGNYSFFVLFSWCLFPCFSAFPCFFASLLFCFFASLLLRFSAFCFSAFPCFFVVLASLLVRFLLLKPK